MVLPSILSKSAQILTTILKYSISWIDYQFSDTKVRISLMITKNYIKIFLYIDYKNYVTIMWSWNQFRNLPKNQGLSAQEQARQYFIHQSNMMMEASSIAVAPAAAGAGAGGGGNRLTEVKPTFTFTFTSVSYGVNFELALDIPSDGGSSGSGGESGGIGLDNLVTEYVTVDWGDGTIDSVLETSNMQFSHTYEGESVNGMVTIKGRYITRLNLSNNGFTSISTGELPSSLQNLYLSNNQLTQFDPTTIALPSSLQVLVLNYNQLTQFDPSQALPSSLQELGLSNNQLTQFNPSIALPSSLQSLDLKVNQLTQFDPTIALPSSLQVLVLNYNQLTQFDPSQALPSSLQELGLSNNQLTQFNPSIALPSSLQSLYLYNNQLTQFDPTIALPSSLQSLDLNNNQLTQFDPTIALPSSLQELYLQINQLNTTAVNTTLVMLDTIYTISGYKQFFLHMNPLAPPSGAGLTAKTSLQSKGYNVVTN